MYVRSMVEAEPAWRGRLTSFFQYLTQAVVKVDRCAMVASLLASDPRKFDELGQELLADVSDVFGRQMEEDASPVGKEDVAEVLRRRFFTADSIQDTNAFRPHVTTAVGNIAALDEQTRKERGAAEDRYLASFPFHPGLTEVFYTRWTQLDGFQRTRGDPAHLRHRPARCGEVGPESARRHERLSERAGAERPRGGRTRAVPGGERRGRRGEGAAVGPPSWKASSPRRGPSSPRRRAFAIERSSKPSSPCFSTPSPSGTRR